MAGLEAGETKKGNNTIWEPFYFRGCLFFYVDSLNPSHLKVLDRSHGRKEWVEVWTDNRKKRAA